MKLLTLNNLINYPKDDKIYSFLEFLFLHIYIRKNYGVDFVVHRSITTQPVYR